MNSRLATRWLVALILPLCVSTAVQAEQGKQLRVVDTKGKTLAMVNVPSGSTSIVRAAVSDTAGTPRNGVLVSLVDTATNKVVKSGVTGTVDLGHYQGAVIADASKKKEQKSDGSIVFESIPVGVYQLVIQDATLVASTVEVLETTGGAGANVVSGGAMMGAGGAGAGGSGGAGGVGLAGAGAALGGAAVVAGGIAAASDSDGESGGDEAVPPPVTSPTVAPPRATPQPTRRPPRPSRPHSPSGS